MSNLIAEVARLKGKMEESRADIWSDGKRETLRDGLENAAPVMLEALSLIKPGDADKIEFFMSDSLCPDTDGHPPECCSCCEEAQEFCDVLRRMAEMCRKLEEEDHGNSH